MSNVNISRVNFVEATGFVAGLCTTFASVPQLVLVFKSKSTKDLSYGTMAMMNIGLVLWTLYGWFITNMPLVIWDTIALTISLMLLGSKIYFEHRKEITDRPSDIEVVRLVNIECA